MTRSIMNPALALLAIGCLSISPCTAGAQEHPEHPSGSAKPAKAALTVKRLAQAIKEYVASDAEIKGGYFLVFDPVTQRPLGLTLDHVHEERLSSLGDDVYFACADFKASDGTVYDLDIFMEEDEGELEATEVHIHKENGKPRYTWKEERGVWEREAVK